MPGEIKGYWEAHKLYGKLPWKRLFEPTIKLCEEGVIISKYVANDIYGVEDSILNSSTLRPILVNSNTSKVKTVI